MLSPFRKATTYVAGGVLIVWAILCVLLGSIAGTGYAVAYKVALGHASAFDPDVHGGGTARALAVALEVIGWLALPVTFAAFLGLLIDRKLAVSASRLTDAEREYAIGILRERAARTLTEEETNAAIASLKAREQEL